MERTTTTMRLITEESQPPIRCFTCGEVANWAITSPRRDGLYEMQAFCHQHFHELTRQFESARTRLDRLRAKLDAVKG